METRVTTEVATTGWHHAPGNARVGVNINYTLGTFPSRTTELLPGKEGQRRFSEYILVRRP
jgi:hypothetical protein